MPIPSPFMEPTLRSDLPLYPHLMQTVRIGVTTVPGPSGYGSSSFLGPLLYVGATQQLRTDTILPRDREPCLANDLNGLGLAPGYYNGRLAGSYNSLPVYDVTGAAVLPGLTQTQLNTVLISLSQPQIATLNNLSACQLQALLTLNVSQIKLLTDALTPTQITNLVDGWTSAQLTSIVTALTQSQMQILTSTFSQQQLQVVIETLTSSQLHTFALTLTTAEMQRLSTTFNAQQLQNFVEVFTPAQIHTLLSNLTTTELQTLVTYTPNQMLQLFNQLSTAQLQAQLDLGTTPLPAVLGGTGSTTGAGAPPRLQQTGTSPLNRVYVAGHITGPLASSGFSPTSNTIYAMPFPVSVSGTIDRIEFEVTGGSLVGAKARLGIYQATSTTDLTPLTLLLDCGEITFSTTGIKSIGSLAQTLTAGNLYYLVILMATSSVTCRNLTTSRMPAVLGVPSTWGATGGVGFTASQSYGALPSTFPSATVKDTASDDLPAVGVHFSA